MKFSKIFFNFQFSTLSEWTTNKFFQRKSMNEYSLDFGSEIFSDQSIILKKNKPDKMSLL